MQHNIFKCFYSRKVDFDYNQKPKLIKSAERLYKKSYTKNGIISIHVFSSVTLEETNEFDIIYDRYNPKTNPPYITSLFLDTTPDNAYRILTSTKSFINELILPHDCTKPYIIPHNCKIKEITSNVRSGCDAIIPQSILRNLTRFVGITLCDYDGEPLTDINLCSISTIILPDKCRINSIKHSGTCEKLTCLSVNLKELTTNVNKLTVNKYSQLGKQIIEDMSLKVNIHFIQITTKYHNKI